jgi:hypothetical protein
MNENNPPTPNTYTFLKIHNETEFQSTSDPEIRALKQRSAQIRDRLLGLSLMVENQQQLLTDIYSKAGNFQKRKSLLFTAPNSKKSEPTTQPKPLTVQAA